MKPQFIDSKDLLKACPLLEKQDGWERFVREFDKPEHRTNRVKAARDSKPPQMAESVSELRELCSTIKRLHLSLFQRFQSSRTFHMSCEVCETRGLTSAIAYSGKMASFPGNSEEERQRWLAFESALKFDLMRLTAAVALAEKVDSLFGKSEEGRMLWQALESEIKRRRCPPSKRLKRNTTELCIALSAFIQRELRLPTKKELNREANRLHHCEDGYLGEHPFGKIVYWNDEETRSRANRYYVYDSRSKFGIDENGNIQTCMQCRIVPWAEWEAPRWDNPTQYADCSTPSGLKGLPEAHDKKGKKVRN